MIEAPFTYGGARPPLPRLEWTRPVRPALQVAAALDQVRRAPSILRAMRLAPDVGAAVERSLKDGTSQASILVTLQEAVEDGSDTVTGLAAVHALARIPGDRVDDALTRLILDDAPGFGAHAIWTMSGRRASVIPLMPLARAVAAGGWAGMLAQQVLARWASQSGDSVLAALETVLRETGSAAGRRYLVETIGLLSGRYPSLSLERVASDGDEATEVRRTAIAAFAERAGELLPRSVADLGRTEGELGLAVHLVRARRSLARRGPRRDARRDLGVRIAQVHLAATIEAEAEQAGMGEAGGVATLLARLRSALPGRRGIAGVVTVTRGLAHEKRPTTYAHDGGRDEHIPLAPHEGGTFASRWPALVEITRGIRAAFLSGATPDVVHLRMADPGSLAAAAVARELGVPTVFSFAPDPHAPIAAAESSGALGRPTFAQHDARGALWYRARLVERLARDARELVLFPRANIRARLTELTGIDIAAGPPNHTVVPEGIDTARTDRAIARVAESSPTPAVLALLERRIEALPRDRHGLPLVVSVGRLQAVKGMARLVQAFAVDASLAARANLVIVGGDLDDPSSAEAAELTRIRLLFERHPGLADRVVLLGHRPHDDVALVLAAARLGWAPLIAPSGAYACGSVKEEFGLAIVEAMAAGLAVVAPRDGGPATYLEEGVTGALVDTADPGAIARGMHTALDLAADPRTAGRSRRTVDDRFTLDRMVRTLAAVYRVSAGAASLALPVAAPADDTSIGDDTSVGVAA